MENKNYISQYIRIQQNKFHLLYSLFIISYQLTINFLSHHHSQ